MDTDSVPDQLVLFVPTDGEGRHVLTKKEKKERRKEEGRKGRRACVVFPYLVAFRYYVVASWDAVVLVPRCVPHYYYPVGTPHTCVDCCCLLFCVQDDDYIY